MFLHGIHFFIFFAGLKDADAKLSTMKQLVSELNGVTQHTLKRLLDHLMDVADYEKVFEEIF